MDVRVVYNKKESTIRAEQGWTVMKLMTAIHKAFGVEPSRQRLYAKKQPLSAEMVLTRDTFGEEGVVVLRNNILYVHYNGMCFALMTPPTYKLGVILECYSNVFTAKGCTLDLSRIDCFYRTTKLELDRSLRYYDVRDADTIVLVDRKEKAVVPEEWKTMLENMQARVRALEHQVERDELTISELSALFQNAK